MKKNFILFLSGIFFIIIFMPIRQVKAAGSFQLVNFNATTTAMEGSPFSREIGFLYSGDAVPTADFVGNNLPDGAKISTVISKGNALYSFTLSGTVKIPGEYLLTLILTDNDGALLTQPYTLTVVGLGINMLTDSLPRGDVNKSYSAVIYFDFTGYIGTPEVTGLPTGVTSKFDSQIVTTPSTKGYFSGRGQITLTGTVNSSIRHYDIKIFIPMDVYPQYNINRTYYLDINEPTISSTTNYTPQNGPVENVKSIKIVADIVNETITREKELIQTIDKKLINKIKGRILLQVESHGEAWYVNPKDEKKYYMANGDEAYNIMRNLGVGITNKDLEKIKSDKNFAKKHSGKIFLQVEAHGEAYYIDSEGNEHYLKNGEAAYDIMRELGLGITNNDIRKIDIGETN